MVFKINRKLLPIKAHYFMFNAAVSPVSPYLATYARQLGLSTVFVGFIYTTLAMISLVTKPLFGYIADKFRLHKTLIIILQVVIASAFMGIYFLKPIALRVPFDLHNDRLQFCPDVEPVGECLWKQVNSQLLGASMLCLFNCTGPNASSFSLDIGLESIEAVGECLKFDVHNATIMLPDPAQCEGSCSNANVMHILHSNRREQQTESSYPPQLWFFAVLMVFGTTGIATMANLNNAVCSTILGDGKRHLFGRQRAWGSFGWGSFTLLAGLMVDQMSRGQVLKDYSAVFYLMLAWMVCDVFAASAIPMTITERSGSMMADVGRLCVRPRIVVFLLWCTLCGIATSFVGNFLFWYLEDMTDAVETTSCDIDSSKEFMKTLQGLVMGVQTFGGEIPLFFLSGWLLKHLGYGLAMSLVLAGHGVRFLLYSVLTNPWWTLPIEMLQGLTVGLFFAVMVSYSGNVAPKGAEATMQGISSAIFDGVGKSIGGLIGGYAMKHLGGRMMFRWFGFAALIICVLHVAVMMLFGRIFPEPEMPASTCEEFSEEIFNENGAEIVKQTHNGRKYTFVSC